MKGDFFLARRPDEIQNTHQHRDRPTESVAGVMAEMTPVNGVGRL